jgi:DNA-binding response OmpR family regulator
MNISKGRILCTDDEADIRDLVAFVLWQQGYEVECTDSAEEALAHARDGTLDLFLFDNWLPGMSGIELAL